MSTSQAEKINEILAGQGYPYNDEPMRTLIEKYPVIPPGQTMLYAASIIAYASGASFLPGFQQLFKEGKYSTIFEAAKKRREQARIDLQIQSKAEEESDVRYFWPRLPRKE